ncbi:MAG: PDZ domain-containing protein [Chloroflexi bacterium]|nr:PDZ domain-containing protein [Chloroflexota bacterium]
MVRKSGQGGVPVIEVDGEIIVGFDRARLERIIASSRARRPALGAKVADSRAIAARMPGKALSEGAYVGTVNPGSPAETAGLRAGDVITSIANRPIRNASDVEGVLRDLAAGARVAMTVVRDGQSVSLSLML